MRMKLGVIAVCLVHSLVNNLAMTLLMASKVLLTEQCHQQIPLLVFMDMKSQSMIVF